MVRAERAFLDELGIARLAAVAGGSLGGMQALEWAVQLPATRSTRSFRSRARTRCIRRAWPGMRSRATRSPPIRTGRAATTTAPDARRTRAWASRAWSGTSRTSRRRSLGDKFGRRLQFADDIRYVLTEPEFEVESYLRHQADSFVKRFDANTYLYTSRALSYFDLARQYGGGQLARAVRDVSARTLLIAFSSDWLYPPAGSEELAAALRAAGKDVELHVIDAPYGHDCFLLEEARQTPMIQPVPRALAGQSDAEETFMEESREFGFDTRQVHAGQRPDPNTGARAVPIYQTTSYVFEDPESAAAYFNLQEYGNTYSRIMNPTVAVFEERMANLEGGCGARRVRQRHRGAGGGALHAAVARRPRRVVVRALRRHGQSAQAPAAQDVGRADVGRSRRSRRVEGGRPRRTRRRFSARRSATPAATCSTSRRSRRSRTSTACRCSSTTRSRRRSCAVRSNGAPTSSLHSATKFIGGHGTSIGGVVVDSGTFNWSNGRFPVVADPSPAYHGLQFHETFGTYGYLMKLRAETLRDLGACMSPFNAFLFLQGLETLSLRMERHVANAAAVASYLEWHALVSNVHLPGPERRAATGRSSRSTCRAARARCSRSTSAAAATAGQDFIRGVTLWSHLANVGDAKSLDHPSREHHASPARRSTSSRRPASAPGTIRLSVGIEDVDDLIWDLEQGFARASAAARPRRRRR